MGVNKYRITESTLEKIGVVYPRNTVSTKPPPGFLRAIKATKTLTRVFESAHDQHQTPTRVFESAHREHDQSF
jgi:hypothetical protein